MSLGPASPGVGVAVGVLVGVAVGVRVVVGVLVGALVPVGAAVSDGRGVCVPVVLGEGDGVSVGGAVGVGVPVSLNTTMVVGAPVAWATSPCGLGPMATNEHNIHARQPNMAAARLSSVFLPGLLGRIFSMDVSAAPSRPRSTG